MIQVGIIGLGMMGNTHLDVYAKRDDVQVVAISDADAKRLSGEEKAGGNIEGQAKGGVDLSNAARYAEGKQLIKDKNVQLVDICLPTPMHLDYTRAALRAGKHVLIEKPLARTYRDAVKIAQAADKAATSIIMPAMCMRFWPGWDWLKKSIDEQTYGKVLAAHFRRVTSHPAGRFYSDGDACGGAALDLHIHDTDFIQWCFGMPEAVSSFGYSRVTSEIDHILTRYDFGTDGPIVTAEGGWAMANGFGFQMRFTVNFEHATAEFDIGSETPLTLCQHGERKPVDLPAGMGYEHEIGYLLHCIQTNTKPKTVTIHDAAESVKIVEAEVKSIQRGKPVKIQA